MSQTIIEEYNRALAVDVSSADQSMNIDAGMPYARSFIVGTAGALAIVTPGGDSVTVNLPVGQFRLSAVTVVKSGTTASGVTALY